MKKDNDGPLKRDNIEIGLNRDGSIDEIFVRDPHDGHCLFHLEQMTEVHYWMRAYGTTQDLVAHIGATVGEREGNPICDEEGHIIDHEKFEGAKVFSDFEWEDSTHESECGDQSRTPAPERRLEVAELINKYGVAELLEEIVGIFGLGRKADHELNLMTDLTNARTRYQVQRDQYYDKKWAAEDEQEDG